MYRLLSAFGLIVLLGSCNNNASQETENKNLLPTDLVKNPQTAGGDNSIDKNALPILELKDTLYNFGPLTAGETVEHEFPFTNSGKGPLIISGADASCGCTVADYPREPVAPGKGGVFTVKFNSADKQGHQEKLVTIKSNASNGTRYISIQAEVKPAGK